MARHRLQELGVFIRQKREDEELSLRDAAKRCGVGFNTLARVERGHIPDLETFQRIVEWLGVPAGDFFGDGPRRTESTPDVIAEHLQSDPALPPEAARKMAAIMREMYGALAARGGVAVHLRAAKTFKPGASHLLAGLLRDMHAAIESGDDDGPASRLQDRS